jgi:hypothetical protein
MLIPMVIWLNLKIENMSKIRKFINDNNISFEEGNRNSTVTTLIGYAQYLEMSKVDLAKELETEITEDKFIAEEIDRIWNFCKIKNYKDYWVDKLSNSYSY